ncbi:molecular chaperone [Novosphingobium sp.]|uniref:fimbrial biogenesis chaperone n=1 Tax=Novosphingobium sp. TaxID=1874826 RepID=UPI003B51AB4B
MRYRGDLAGLAIALASGLTASPALASGLQVDPVSVTITGRSGSLFLSNLGDTPLQSQIRVYQWAQDGRSDVLSPTDGLLASPPMAAIETNGRQLVRLVAANPKTCEDAYRLSVDEVPPITPAGTAPGAGLHYVLHYSLPVFVTARGCARIRPELGWHLVRQDKGVALIVSNQGAMHAQLAGVRLVTTTGVQIELTPGLLGYVLPGQTRTFTFPVVPDTLAGAITLELAVNGSHVTQPLVLGTVDR